MSQEVMSESAYIREFERVIERLSFVIETENEALEQGNISVVASIQQDKYELSQYFHQMWLKYKKLLNSKNSKRQEMFVRMSDALDGFKKLVDHNFMLLNALKTSSATRIEASMNALKRQVNHSATSYSQNAVSDTLATPPRTTRSRLI